MLKRLPLVVILAGASSAWAQQVISAHSGVIHFVEGQVTVEGQPVQPKFAEFPDVKNGQTLATQDGRAEVLLTPGVILRIGENSSFKMLSNSRADTRLEVLSGEAIVEVGELLPTNAITLVSGSVHMGLVKKGIYRIDAEDPGKFRVYDGEARVTGKDQTLVARKGRQVVFGAVLDMSAFDVKETDALMRWAERRSEYLATANVSAARSASSLGYVGNSFAAGGLGTGGLGMGGLGMGSWAYNPYYGMFTYLPFGNNLYYSPFGYPFYSSANVGYFVPSTGFNGSAFPIANASNSPHFNSSGTRSIAPRPSSMIVNNGNAAAPATTGLNSVAPSSNISSGAQSGASGRGAAAAGRGK